MGLLGHFLHCGELIFRVISHEVMRAGGGWGDSPQHSMKYVLPQEGFLWWGRREGGVAD